MATAAITAPPAAATKADWREAGMAAGAALIVLAASLGNFLAYNRYPALRPEVALLLAGFAILAALYGLLYRRSGNLGRAVLEMLLVYFAVDLNSDMSLVAAAAAAIVGLLRLRTEMSLLPIVSITAGAVLLASIVGLTEHRPALLRTERAAGPLSSQPAILHLILDEHGGVAGMTDPAMKSELQRFYADRGFRIFTHAYSQHFHTVNAIPDILNYGRPGNGKNVDETLDVGSTAYLDLLGNSRRLHIYQSDFADYCQYAKVASCTRYWSPSLSFVEPLNVSAGEKARLMAYKFVALSRTIGALVNIYNLTTYSAGLRERGVPMAVLKQNSLSGTLGGFAIIDRMAADVKKARPGEAYFAHVLAPHYPYVMSPDCIVRAPSKWEYRRSTSPIAVREAASHDQLRCLGKRLDRLIDSFLSSPGGRDGIIVIHGDHGSRITVNEPVTVNRAKLTPADMMAGYSTLFAVRAPAIQPGVEQRPFPVAAILGQLARSGFSSVSLARLQPGSGEIYLDGPNWSVGERASIAKAWPDTRLTEHQPTGGTVRGD